MKNILFKLLISFIFFQFPVFANVGDGFVSISPAMTEIMFAIGAEDKLKAVSDMCDYPVAAKNKEKIGSGYILNTERIINLKPRYILALDSSAAQLHKFKKFGIEPLCFEYENVEAVLQNIEKLGKLTGNIEQAHSVIKKINTRIKDANKNHGVKILYLVSGSPLITIGRQSFITDIIEKSGNLSVTSELNMAYPVVNIEYLVKKNPEIVMIVPYADENPVKKFFPRARVIKLTEEETSIIHRPASRIDEAVEFFGRF